MLVIVKPIRCWWEFLIRKQYTLVEGKHFKIEKGTIKFFKAAPKGWLEVKYNIAK